MCEKTKCALKLIYPNGDNATYACDDECYFSYCDDEIKEWYLKHYPKEMNECNCLEK